MTFFKKGQSLVEFAMMLPLLPLLPIGVVEVVIFVGNYINLIDRDLRRLAPNIHFGIGVKRLDLFG